jgi:tetratricopeptide (TPR) repeat protein
MNQTVSFLTRLGLRQDADEREIRRAYARELKQIDQEADPDAFQALREAYDQALAWTRRNAADAEPPAPPQLPPAEQVAEPASAPVPAPTPEPASPPEPEEDFAVLAGTVFDDFRQRSETIPNERPALPEAPWVRELHQALDDPRLIAIPARHIFEHRIAHLLAEGWQLGHEALLVAAIKVFSWDKDRRRTLSLGRAGAIIDAAIYERENYELQVPALRSKQRRIIQRLRDAKPPSRRELVLDTPTMELLIARFPNWLALITSDSNAREWRKRNAELPAWKRKLTFANIGTPRELTDSKSFPWTWLVLLSAIFLVIVMSSHQRHVAPPPPRLTSQQFLTNAMAEGMAHLNQANYPAAVVSFARAIRDNNKSAKAYAYHAMASILNGDDYNAQRDLETAEKLNPSEPMISRARGVMAKKRNSYDAAIAAFSKSLQLEPDHPYTLSQRAETYYSKGDYASALQDTERLLTVKKDDLPPVHMLRALIMQKQDNKAGAIKEMKAAIAAKPKEARLYQAAAGVYLDWKQRDKALAVLDAGIQAAPDTTLYMQRARINSDTDTAATLRDLDRVLQLKPNLVEAIRLRAELAFNSGHWQDAVSGLGNALNSTTFDSRSETLLRTERGIMYYKKEQFRLASQGFNIARAAAKSAADLSEMCGLMVVNNAAVGTALEVCDAALVRTSADPQTLNHKGTALLLLKRYDEAVDVFSAAIRYGDRASAWYGRAIAKQRSGDAAGGSADATQARKRNADAGAQYARLGLKLS